MDAVRKLFVSLLVHEKPEVILNQLRNFRRYAPRAIIVLHVSKSMDLTDDLLAEIEALGQVRVNPTRIGTGIYSLLGPHHENLRFILSMNPADTDAVTFHASNDMLVREGVEDYVQSHVAAYHHEGRLDPLDKSEGLLKIFGDEEFAAMRKLAGAEVVLHSQIEGSFFQIQHLRQVVRVIEETGADLAQARPYFAEEIMLPTLAHGFIKKSDQPIGLPYVMSEVSFLASYYEISHKLFGQGFMGKVCFHLLWRLCPKSISPRLVDGIRKEDIGFYERFRIAHGMVRFNVHQLFGVKRVLREINDPLRVYISRLD